MPQLLRYIVASTPRTGSNLFCECMEATGIAGNPMEAFAPDFKSIWYRRWSLPEDASFADYLQAAIHHGTRNNVFGLKIQWMHVPGLARDAGLPDNGDVLDALFACNRFINIIRRDRLAQAISWYRAIETNEWYRVQGSNSGPGNGLHPQFSPKGIRDLERHLEWQQHAWNHYFQKRGITPFIIEYEALAENHRTQTANALAFLGLNPERAFEMPPPRLMRQADDVSIRWQQLMEAASPLEQPNLCSSDEL